MTRNVEPTTAYWQALHDALPLAETRPPFRFAYPVCLPDGRWLRLPIRPRAQDPDRAVASFIANHASFTLLDALGSALAEQTRARAAEVVVGLPTLGLALAPPLARALGHDRFVPFGTSRKFWYDDALSAETSSFTTATVRRLYVDPNLVPLLAGRRVLLVDDTISSGGTVLSALDVLGKAGAEVVGLAFAMSQGDRWRARLPIGVSRLVDFLFQTPHLVHYPGNGWRPDA